MSEQHRPALVLGMARNYFQHGSLGIVRSLGRLGAPVHCVFGDTDTPATRSRYLFGVHKIELGAPDRSIVNQLCDLGLHIESGPLLFPTDDVASGFILKHADALRDVFLFAEQDLNLVEALSNKLEMARLCETHGIPTPKVFVPSDAREAASFAEQTGYPVVVKAIDAATSQRVSGASVSIAKDPADLARIFEDMSRDAPDNVMLQEYVPGGPEDVWMFNGYFDASGRCLVGYSGRKLRQFPPYTGMTSLGECRTVTAVIDSSVRFLEGVGYKGPVDLGMRFDARDGTYKMLDINPRMGATFRLFVGERGMDIARAMYLDLTGQRVDGDDRPTEGRRWLVEHFDLASSLSYIKDGTLTMRSWVSSLRGIEEGAWFARDDVKPFLKMLLDSFVMFVRWIVRRLIRR